MLREGTALAGALAALAIFATPPVPQPVTLNGKPFPDVAPYIVRVSPARRTFFVAVAKENGDGSANHPWNDIQTALRALAPGDQLRVKAGTYKGNYRIDETCRDGPIEVVFDAKAVVIAASSEPALLIRRSNWHLAGFFVNLGQSPNGGIIIQGSSISVDRSWIEGGAGPGVKVEGAARDVTISNSRITKRDLEHPTADSIGIAVATGVRKVVVANNHIHNNPAGAIRITGSRDVRILGNTIRDNRAVEITIATSDTVQVMNNTLERSTDQIEGKGIVLEKVSHVVVRSNHIANAAVAFAVGRVDPGSGAALPADDVTIDHNYIEAASPTGVAVGVEAGNGIRFVNNVAEGCPSGVLLLGKRPQTSNVVIANNLFLAVSAQAFVIRDPAAYRLFDFNVFSPAQDAINVEVGSEKLALADFLRRGTMPHTSRVAGVHLFQRDLSRVAGIETIDRGTRVGIAFKGKEPDLGVSER